MPKRRKSQSTIALPWEGTRGGIFRYWLTGARLVAVGLAVILVVLVVVTFRGQEERERARTTRQAIEEVEGALVRFREELGRCPRSTVELVHPPSTGRRFLREMPKDGWGRELHVECPGYFDPDGVDVISAGPSGSFLVDDNIQ
jgi:hypothetical protein